MPKLSRREREVLAGLWQHGALPPVAQALGLSHKYCVNVAYRLYRKLGVHTAVQACREGLRRGYLQVEP